MSNEVTLANIHENNVGMLQVKWLNMSFVNDSHVFHCVVIVLVKRKLTHRLMLKVTFKFFSFKEIMSLGARVHLKPRFLGRQWSSQVPTQELARRLPVSWPGEVGSLTYQRLCGPPARWLE